MPLNDITPLRSVGDIWLGSKENDVTELIGFDFTRTVDDEGDVEIEYVSLGLQFSFWSDSDFKLGCIGVRRSSATLLGSVLSGHSKKRIELFINNRLNASVSDAGGCIHNDRSIQEWIDVDTLGLSFWFENDALYLIDVFCDWIDADTPKWPS